MDRRKRILLFVVMLSLIATLLPYFTYNVLVQYCGIYAGDAGAFSYGVFLDLATLFGFCLYSALVERDKLGSTIFGIAALSAFVIFLIWFLYGVWVASSLPVVVKSRFLIGSFVGVGKKVFVLHFNVSGSRTVHLSVFNPSDRFMKVRLEVASVKCGDIPRDFIVYHLSKWEFWVFPRSSKTVNLAVEINLQDDANCTVVLWVENPIS